MKKSAMIKREKGKCTRGWVRSNEAPEIVTSSEAQYSQ